MPRPGDTIQRRLTLDRTPDADPVVRVFRNGVRTATATLTGVATSYLVSYAIPGGWLATDYVQVVAYPLFGAVQYAEELFAGRLGAAIRPDDRVTAAIVLDQVPDATPTTQVYVEGVATAAQVTTSAGAVTTEFATEVYLRYVGHTPPLWPAGFTQAVITAVIGGDSYPSQLWGLTVYDSTTPPVSANLVWSLPEDRNAGTAAAMVAVRQRATVGEESDVRLAFTAAGAAAVADDLSARELEADVAVNTGEDPVLTLTEGDGVTTTGATTFEVAFAATTANGLSPGAFLVSVYDVASGQRTWLANVLVTASNTALRP